MKEKRIAIWSKNPNTSTIIRNYLQRNDIPFEESSTSILNDRIFRLTCLKDDFKKIKADLCLIDERRYFNVEGDNWI